MALGTKKKSREGKSLRGKRRVEEKGRVVGEENGFKGHSFLDRVGR